MAANQDFVSPMQPTPNDTMVFIPVSFEYGGSRSESNRSKYVIIAAIAVVTLILVFLSVKSFTLSGLIKGTLLLLIGVFAIRFPLLKEHRYRKSLTTLLSEDYKLDAASFWSIVNVDSAYPHLVHFKDGTIGLFVHFEPDAIVGKGLDSDYKHFNAIADALNAVANYNISVSQVDLMDSNGLDPRINAYTTMVSKMPNPEIRDFLQIVAADQRANMSENVSSSDYYVFLGKGSERNFIQVVNDIVLKFMEANYATYRYLNSEGIRELARSLFNLHDFSLLETSREAFASKVHFVVPLVVMHSDGTEERLNPSREERLALEAQKRESKKGSPKKAPPSSTETFDLF